MGKPTVHLLYTCPFSWKIRGLIDYIGLDVDYIGINGLRAKKELAFVEDWNKVPVLTDSDGSIHYDSTPMMFYLDEKYNSSKLATMGDLARRDEWLQWVDTKMSKATIPILYGGLFSALQTTVRVSKLEKFGFFSRRLYAWAGFPIMWGFIARSRVKKDGRTPKQLWHDLLSEFTSSHNGDFFSGDSPDLVDFAAFGYMRSISPFPQFSKLEDHEAGMAWYNRMMATIQ